MLVPIESIIPFFICPKTSQKLLLEENRLISLDRENIYEILDGTPILIDYSKSILSKDSIRNSSAKSLIYRSPYVGFQKIIKDLINPVTRSTKKNIKRLILELFNISNRPKILVVGGGSIGKGLNELYDDLNIEIVAFDIYASNNVQFVADAHSIPLQNDYFDGVIIQAVLEHVLEPSKVIAEIYRVLKMSGIVYSEVPFMQHVHEAAYDFSRFTDSGHRYLFKNFRYIDSGAVSGVGTQLLWSIEYFTRSLFRSRVLGKIIKLFLFWLQYVDSIAPKSYTIDAAGCVYFIGQKNEDLISPEDIVKHYQGSQ